MLLHKQEHLVTADNPIKRGSCYPTVIACLLDLPLHHVPYFHLYYWTEEERENFQKVFAERYCDGDYEKSDENGKSNYRHYLSLALNFWHLTLELWLASQGYRIKKIKTENYDKWLYDNPDIPYMVSGTSSRGVGHVVIYKNGKLCHDPHPSEEGLVELDKEPYEILVKI